MSGLVFGETPEPNVLTVVAALDGRGARVRCPQPHFDSHGHPKDGPAAFAYVIGGVRVIACQAHEPRTYRDALAAASDGSAAGAEGLGL